MHINKIKKTIIQLDLCHFDILFELLSGRFKTFGSVCFQYNSHFTQTLNKCTWNDLVYVSNILPATFGLLGISFIRLFPNSHCRYIGSTGGSGFNLIDVTEKCYSSFV